MMKSNQIVSLLLVALLIVGGIIYLGKHKVGPTASGAPALDVALPESDAGMETPVLPESDASIAASSRIAAKAEKFPRAKEIAQPSGFVNTNGLPITLSQYVGKKVILLDIMTYSCINCIRTFPYLVDWYKKYEDKGLIIIGIHTPEFDFEKDIDNVKAAMAKYGIKFPVVLDNDYGTWNAYNNHYWPMKYIIDIDGFVRFTHIGEGGYDETEKVIQDLLKERADALGAPVDVNVPVTVGATETGSIGQSPETYFGSARNEYLGNGVPGQSESRAYKLPSIINASTLYLDGSWSVRPESAENTGTPARIVYKFAAKHVYLVASADKATEVRVTVDGKPLGKQVGGDVSESNGISSFTVRESRLYDVYSGDTFGVHTIEFSPQTPGLKAFAFTFGN